MKQLVITVTINAVRNLGRGLKVLRTKNPVNLRVDAGVGVKKMRPSFREFLKAARKGVCRAEGVGSSKTLLESQGTKGFRAFAISRAHTLTRIDKRTDHMVQITVIEKLATAITNKNIYLKSRGAILIKSLVAERACR